MTIRTISMRFAPVACAAALLLTGCGGGGGGDGTPATPATLATPSFDASNYQATAEPVAASVESSASVADALSGFTNLEAAAALGQAAAQPDPLGLLKRAMGRSGNGLEQLQALQTTTEACPGGGRLVVTTNDADSNGELSSGDSASIRAEGCVADGSTINGTLGINVTQYSASAAKLGVTFSNFRADGTSINGSATLNVTAGTQSSLHLSYDNVAFSEGGRSLRLSYTTTMLTTPAGGMSLRIEGGIGMNGHDYTLTQPSNFVVNSAGVLQPGGVLQVSGAAGERVRVVAGTGRFTYQYFAPTNSGTVPDATRDGLTY